MLSVYATPYKSSNIQKIAPTRGRLMGKFVQIKITRGYFSVSNIDVPGVDRVEPKLTGGRGASPWGRTPDFTVHDIPTYVSSGYWGIVGY